MADPKFYKPFSGNAYLSVVFGQLGESLYYFGSSFSYVAQVWLANIRISGGVYVEFILCLCLCWLWLVGREHQENSGNWGTYELRNLCFESIRYCNSKLLYQDKKIRNVICGYLFVLVQICMRWICIELFDKCFSNCTGLFL